eukprot:4121367-Alexandrium_andersonii.AAC.1
MLRKEAAEGACATYLLRVGLQELASARQGASDCRAEEAPIQQAWDFVEVVEGDDQDVQAPGGGRQLLAPASR